MKALLKISLKTSSAHEAQQTLLDLCAKLKQEGGVTDCQFEIETPAGTVTEKCLLQGERVIA